jgi:hypothetical protein
MTEGLDFAQPSVFYWGIAAVDKRPEGAVNSILGFMKVRLLGS